MGEVSETSPLLTSNGEGKAERLGLLSSAAFILSVLGIPPVVALPGALQHCGLVGFLIIPGLLMINAYTAIMLAKSWLLLEKHWPLEASLQLKYPYSALAQRAGGQVLRRLVNTIQNMAIFGEAVPFLLLASENIQNVINGLTNEEVKFSFCYILIATAVIFIPFLWLGTPRDLQFMTWVGAGSLVVVFFLILTLLFLDAPRVDVDPSIMPKSWSSIAYCFGAVAFQFGIHPVLLTLQMDMKDKNQLPKALVIAFIVALFVFGGIATAAFFLYGKAVQANLLNNFYGSPLLYITQGIVSVQSLICLALGINALFQDLEETTGMQHTFGWPRIILRSTVMLLVLFAAESIPHFAVSLQLVGGLLMTPIIYIFPPLLSIILKHQAKIEIKKTELAIKITIVILGIIGCIASTTESGIQISQLKKFAPPCYVDIDVN